MKIKISFRLEQVLELELDSPMNKYNRESDDWDFARDYFNNVSQGYLINKSKLINSEIILIDTERVN